MTDIPKEVRDRAEKWAQGFYANSHKSKLAYLAGYQSRDEEVRELREALEWAANALELYQIAHGNNLIVSPKQTVDCWKNAKQALARATDKRDPFLCMKCDQPIDWNKSHSAARDCHRCDRSTGKERG